MTALEYIGIEVKKTSYELSFKEIDLVGVTFSFPPCFKDHSILSIDDWGIIRRQDDTSYLELR